MGSIFYEMSIVGVGRHLPCFDGNFIGHFRNSVLGDGY
jgi:hypothetical protein